MLCVEHMSPTTPGFLKAVWAAAHRHVLTHELMARTPARPRTCEAPTSHRPYRPSLARHLGAQWGLDYKTNNLKKKQSTGELHEYTFLFPPTQWEKGEQSLGLGIFKPWMDGHTFKRFILLPLLNTGHRKKKSLLSKTKTHAILI